MRSSTAFFAGAALLSSAVSAAPAPLAAADDSKFTYYNLPTPLSGPCDITTGPDGAIWADTFLANKIVRIDIKTGHLEEYDIPYTLPPLPDSALFSAIQGKAALACVVQPGKDGNMYAASGVRNELVRINTKTKKIDVFNTNKPLGNLEPLNDAWPGPTGMWFSQTTANLITMFDYKTEQFTDYEVPTPLSSPVGIIIPEDGNVWFCEFLANKMGRLNPKTGEITEYPLPLSLAGPAVVRAETEGRYIYFTATIANAIGRIDIYTGEVKAFPNDIPLNFPIEDTNDSQGNVWFSTLTQNTLNYITPSTGKVTHIQQPDTLLTVPVSLIPAADIAIHYEKSDNSIWFSELSKNRIGKYQI